MIATVNRALASTSNPQIIGRNGEVPLRDFLSRYLPYTFRTATGHFVSPSGELSPQIDIMIIDARYPLLSQNADGSVLAMLHSVIGTIEVKTRLATSHISKMWDDAVSIMSLANQVKGYSADEWGTIKTCGFSYGCANRLDAIERKYEKEGRPEQAHLDISLLRLHPKDQTASTPLGLEFHFEPDFKDKSSTKVIGHYVTSIPQFTLLSDLYFRVVQDSYYTLGYRNYTSSHIGRQVMEYMSWSTCPWEKYYEMMASRVPRK